MRKRTPKPRKMADQSETSSSLKRSRENFVLVTSYLTTSSGQGHTHILSYIYTNMREQESLRKLQVPREKTITAEKSMNQVL